MHLGVQKICFSSALSFILENKKIHRQICGKAEKIWGFFNSKNFPEQRSFLYFGILVLKNKNQPSRVFTLIDWLKCAENEFMFDQKINYFFLPILHLFQSFRNDLSKISTDCNYGPNIMNDWLTVEYFNSSEFFRRRRTKNGRTYFRQFARIGWGAGTFSRSIKPVLKLEKPVSKLI